VYEVLLERSAERDLKALDPEAFHRVVPRIRALSQEADERMAIFVTIVAQHEVQHTKAHESPPTNVFPFSSFIIPFLFRVVPKKIPIPRSSSGIENSSLKRVNVNPPHRLPA
jgi:hypothetical protein